MGSYSREDKDGAAELVFFPIPFTGHLASTIETAKFLVQRDDRISISIFIIDLPFDPNAAAFARSIASSLTHTRIRFVHLPEPDPQQEQETGADTDKPSFSPKLLISLLARYKGRVTDAVAELGLENSGRRLAGFVIDMFCTPMMEVADELRVPSYLYYTSGAYVLNLSLHMQALHDEQGTELTQLTEVSIPGFLNPVPVGRVFPAGVLADKVETAQFVERVRTFKKNRGILVNTFEELESRAIQSLRDADLAHGIPPVYPVGPILHLEGGKKGGDRADEVIGWLDEQPPSSVVFLCFGSMGSFDAEQVQKIATGLEHSGHRFLWSLRRPPLKGKIHPEEYADHEKVLLLPEGFLERTAQIGKVIGWAPQVAVLAHQAIGGFVSHCGWNSVLESLRFGVPIATWPLYAEQQLNALIMVKELGLAVEITLDYKKDLMNGGSNFIVGDEVIERGIKRLMIEGEDGKEVRERVKAMREASRNAILEGGSSYNWAGRFIDDVITNMSSDT